MKTYAPKLKEIERKWHVIDANGQTLGRLSTQIAKILIGKNKPMFARNMDTGDFVIFINAAKILVTGKKASEKAYHRFSGYPGGIREISYAEMMAKHPERIIEHAVKGMLPHTSLGRAMYKKLKVYADDKHPHQAQLAGVKEQKARGKAKAKPRAKAKAVVEAKAPGAETKAPKAEAEAKVSKASKAKVETKDKTKASKAKGSSDK